MAYIGRSPQLGVRTRYYYTATGGETSLSGPDDNGATLVFSDGTYVDVMLNGVTLVAGTDYNTSTANTISGLSALTASDIVEIVVYDVFSVGDAVSKSNGGAFEGAVTFNAGLTANTADINGGTVDGAVVGGTTPAAGTFTTLNASTSLQITTGATVTTILDEDNMASDSATALATQQSIKAYVDGNSYTGSFTIVTANTTIAAGDLIVANSASALTITLPASPTAGDTVTIRNSGTGTVTIGRNGSNILSVAEDGTLNAGTSTQRVYVDATIGWDQL